MDSLNFYKSMLESFYDGIYFVDLERKITFWNKGAELITGFSAEEVVGKHCFDNILNHVDDFGTKLCIQGCPLHTTMHDAVDREIDVYLHHKDGHRVKIAARTTPIYDNGEIVGCVEIFKSTAEQDVLHDDGERQYSIDELKLLALHDQLTGLPNRRYTENFINGKIDEFNKLGLSVGIVFMDIDDFRAFNNNYGHDVGDDVLKTVAKTFTNVARQHDLIGRWGGEEFVGIFSNVNLEQLKKICERMRMLIENSVLRSGDNEHHVTISIGGTVLAADDVLASAIKRADEQMYLSKENGKNQVHVA